MQTAKWKIKDPVRTVIYAQYTLKSINIFSSISVFSNIKFAGFFFNFFIQVLS